MAGLRSRFAPPPLHFLLVSFRLVLRGTLYVLCYVPVCAVVVVVVVYDRALQLQTGDGGYF